MNTFQEAIQNLLSSRKTSPSSSYQRKLEGEGGCGVIGVAAADKIAGKHLLIALTQMRNRGNGKGGGIAAAGLNPQSFGIQQHLLKDDYLLAIAYLDLDCQLDVEKQFINPFFEVHHVHRMSHISDFKTLPGLEIPPPEAILYFVRVKKEALQEFQRLRGLLSLPIERVEDEFVYQNSYLLNQTFYSSIGEKKAFVLSHGKDLLVLKMVGYGDDVIRYYQLENLQAHIWIGHHRYPTKGRVWHPGGAHPFVGLHEALVHNGDFANYFSLCEYLAQRNIHPLFLTDTEVSVLIFDLWHRIYQYPLEYVIEALAPTTERDFALLPKEKKEIYQQIQKVHMHGSPDGPWFFLIAQSVTSKENQPVYRLIGITDTSMLRPQVFAVQNGSAPIGFAASEKQAIDAALQSLAQEDSRYWTYADHYWNARGGSHTDGGAFSFSVYPNPGKQATLVCSNKFGQPVHSPSIKSSNNNLATNSPASIPDLPQEQLSAWIRKEIQNWKGDQAEKFLITLKESVHSETQWQRAFRVMTDLLDQHFPLAHMKRSFLRALTYKHLSALLDSISFQTFPSYASISFKSSCPSKPLTDTQTLIINAQDFPSEGENSLSREIVRLYKKGFKKFILFHTRGQRFIANGLGPNSHQVQIDVYGSPGDYLASGIDGAQIHVHGDAQDQLAQIMKDGTLVVYGDVGQTFMYGAKGGKAFVKGNAAGRPLINAVGKPRVVINGTCLDYLAESCMAGNPLQDGGFVIVNGVSFDENQNIVELDSPYPGSNLFSLASGGAIYIRDPSFNISSDQLNGGEFTRMTPKDWQLILPYLEENGSLFGIPISRLLEYKKKSLEYHAVYRKIIPSAKKALQEEEIWIKAKD